MGHPVRLANKNTTFTEEFAEKIYFNFDKHLKSKKHVDVREEQKKSSDDEADNINEAFSKYSEIFWPLKCRKIGMALLRYQGIK